MHNKAFPDTKLTRKQIETHMINGKKERGVVLDPSMGEPLGTVRIFSKSSSGVRKEAVVASSDTMDQEDSPLPGYDL